MLKVDKGEKLAWYKQPSLFCRSVNDEDEKVLMLLTPGRKPEFRWNKLRPETNKKWLKNKEKETVAHQAAYSQHFVTYEWTRYASVALPSAGKACQGQPLNPIGPIHYLRRR